MRRRRLTLRTSRRLAQRSGRPQVRSLQLEAPGGSRLDTTTTIQVHILVQDNAACLSVYNFLTDQDFQSIVTGTTLNLGGPKNNRRVVSTNPGQFSDNVLIVNDCGETQTFDLHIILDSYSNNKQAVITSRSVAESYNIICP